MADQSVNISNLFMAKITKEQVKEEFANDPRLDKILTIFDKIDSLDNKKTGQLSSWDLFELELPVVKKEKINLGNGFAVEYEQHAKLDNNNDDKLTEWELEQYYQKSKDFFGKDLSLEDYRKIFGFLASEGDKNYQKELEEISARTGFSKEVVTKLGLGEADAYKLVTIDGKDYLEKKIEGFTTLCDLEGNLLEQIVEDSSVNGCDGFKEVIKFENDKKISTTYINNKTKEVYQTLYGATPEDKIYDIHLKDGVMVRQSFMPSMESNKPLTLEEIVFSPNESDSLKISFNYDKSLKLSGIDINQQSLNSSSGIGKANSNMMLSTDKITLNDETYNLLKSIIDGGAQYGKDYDIRVVEGELKILPKVQNRTKKDKPELKGEALNRYYDLISKGIHADEDFDVEYIKNGVFRYNFKNNQSREFKSNYKTEVYDKNGDMISSLTINGDDVISEKVVNGEKQILEMKFNDIFMELLLEKDFDTAGKILGDMDLLTGGYNLYPMALKYKEITGRELIADANKHRGIEGVANLIAKLCPHTDFQPELDEDLVQEFYNGYQEFKAIIDFDPYKSQIADMLPKIERVSNGENTFSEKINNDNFEVKLEENKLYIAKNKGKQVLLDLSTFPESYQKNVIMQINSAVLYDVAISNTPIKLDDSINDNQFGSTTTGLYDTKEGIKLDPNATIGQRALKTIVHECGHVCDHIDDKDNAIKYLKEQMKDPVFMNGRDRSLTIQEMLDENGTLQPVSAVDEKLNEVFQKELESFNKNPPNVNENAEYALTSIQEFFAESYTLLNTGSCKSEYVIANYFPETLKRVKKLIDQNRAQRENN